MMALFIFPICAILWMVINARLGLVEDQPLRDDSFAPPAAQDDSWEPCPVCETRA